MSRSFCGMSFVWIALGLVLCARAPAQNDLIADIATGTGYVGASVSIKVDYASVTRPSTIQFQILFDPSHVTPASVQASDQVVQAGKQVAWDASQPGTLTVIILGSGGAGNQSLLNDGDLVTVVFGLSGSVTVGQVIPLQGGTITASTPTQQHIDSVIASGSISVTACTQPPAVPSQVAATFGTMADRVRLTWVATNGATSYDVYRSTTNNSATAALLVTVSWATLYDDLAAAAAVLTSGGGGCNGGDGAQASFATYYYWIAAKNACGSSAFSVVAAGLVGQKAALSTKTASPDVLPSAGPGQCIDADAALALRLSAHQPIDPATVWARVTLGPLSTDAVEWLPVGDATGSGWVVYRPHSAWAPGDLISMTAGASTITGEPVGPVSAAFHVSPDGAAPRFAAPLRQPDSGQFGTKSRTDALVILLPHGTAPPTSSDGVGPVYQVQPEAPSPDPFLVWLPVPDGLTAGQVNPCYHLGSDEQGAWYPAENVPGWLASDQYFELIEDGVVYLGFWVHHGGVVQLSAPADTVVSTAAAVRGDLLLVMAGLSALALWRRRTAVILRSKGSRVVC